MYETWFDKLIPDTLWGLVPAGWEMFFICSVLTIIFCGISAFLLLNVSSRPHGRD